MFATYTGLLIDPKNVKLEDINLIDIAHHLTNINRYGGALDFEQHYSVAEHSILLTEYVLHWYDNNIELAKYALMHDASEAYLGDVVSGLKKYLWDYKDIESRLQFTICEKYDVRLCWGDVINELDKRMLLDEVKFLSPHRLPLFYDVKKRPLHLESLSISGSAPGLTPKRIVYDRFLVLAKELGIED